MSINSFYLRFSLISIFVVSLISNASATSQTIVTSTIIGRTPLGLLIDLHIQDFLDANTAILYYNYIAIFFILLWAAFASQANESRYTFTTPFMAGFMVFVGWLNAGSGAAQYWGAILFCMLLGAFMYLNDMNHEKYGLPGTGDKLMAVAFLIMCFTASYGFIASSEIGLFNDNSIGSTQNTMCGTAYTCDASGNVDLGVSVNTVSSTGSSLVLTDIYSLGQIALAMIKIAIIVVGSVLFFSVVIMAAYPALAASPQTVAFLVVMNFVIWAIYYATFFRWFYKPGPGEGQV